MFLNIQICGNWPTKVADTAFLNVKKRYETNKHIQHGGKEFIVSFICLTAFDATVFQFKCIQKKKH